MHTQLAAVMEALVHAAVAELKKLLEDGPVVERSGDAEEEQPGADRGRAESREKMVRRSGLVLCRVLFLVGTVTTLNTS